jgi:hypothetical protein
VPVMADISARYAKPIGIQCGNPSREMINMKHMGANTCAFSTHRTIRHNFVLYVGQPYLYSQIRRWYVKHKFELVANLFSIFDLNQIVVWFQIPKKQLVCKAKYGFRPTKTSHFQLYSLLKGLQILPHNAGVVPIGIQPRSHFFVGATRRVSLGVVICFALITQVTLRIVGSTRHNIAMEHYNMIHLCIIIIIIIV